MTPGGAWHPVHTHSLPWSLPFVRLVETILSNTGVQGALPQRDQTLTGNH